MLKQTLLLQGGLWCTGHVTFLPTRLLPDYYQIPSDSMRHLPFSDSSMQFNSKRCQLASYQLPIRFLSEKILILQRNLDSKPAHHQGCSANFLIFVLKQPLLLQGSFQTLNRFQSYTYQFLSEKILILQRNFDSKPAHHQGCSANF